MLRPATLVITAALSFGGGPSPVSAQSSVPPSSVASDTVSRQPAVDDVDTTVESDVAPVDTEADVPSTSTPETSVPGDVGNEVDRPDTEVDVRPSAPPQVQRSDIPTGSIALALVVLAVVATFSTVLVRRRPGRGDQRQPAARGAVPAPETATLDFLLELGEALIDAGDAVSHVEATLRTVGSVNGIEDLGVLVLPTALIVSVPGSGNVSTEVGAAGRDRLRLDQVDDVLRLVNEAERGRIGVVEGTERLERIRASAPPFRAPVVLTGYVLSTVGLAAILHAGWRELVLAAALGLVIGWFRLATQELTSSYQPFIPLIAATAVSISVFAAARVVADLVTFPVLVSPLIFFLPGALLTIAALELTTGQIVAGASRLAAGGLQLVLLALGIVAGAQLVGIPAGELPTGGDGAFGVIAPWVGVAVFGVGVAWFNGARTSALAWILVVLYVAYSGQVIGGLFFGSSLSAFFGAVAMTPVAVLAARQPSGPTPLVMFLPGFWLLVPGALGLEGVSRILGDGGVGAGALVTTLTSMIGISLGILLGLILAARDPERPWAETRGPE
jgi:uncharacterized membrane protein YjjP (DUF1212 family)